MAFNFKLQAVLKHNKHLEDLARIRFSEFEGKFNAIKLEIKDLYKKIDSTRVDISEVEEAGGYISANVELMQTGIIGIKIKIESKKNELQKVSVLLEEERKKLVLAVQEHKKIEVLKDKSFERYKHDCRKNELKKINDLMVMRFKRES